MVKALLAVVLLAACGTKQTGTRPDLSNSLDASVVMLQPTADTSRCSGVWVSGDRILTAAHCVHGGLSTYSPQRWTQRNDWKWFKALRYFNADLSYLDIEQDLAVVRVKNAPKHRYAHLAAAAPKDGDSVYTVGAPLGYVWNVSYGFVQRANVLGFPGRPNDPMYWTLTTVPVNPGNSGGALFNSRGEVVGITSFKYTGAEGISGFVHWRHLLKALN